MEKSCSFCEEILTPPAKDLWHSFYGSSTSVKRSGTSEGISVAMRKRGCMRYKSRQNTPEEHKNP
jgi:hypothetical protein